MAVRFHRKEDLKTGGAYISMFFIDSKEDISNLPTSTKATEKFEKCAINSIAVMYGTGSGSKIYGLNSEDEWVEI